MKDKNLTVGELKAEIPLIDAYEFRKYNFYIFIVKPEGGINPLIIPKLKAMLDAAKVRNVFIVADNEGMRIFKLDADDGSKF